MPQITIDRNKLVEYVIAHAEQLVTDADIDIDTNTIEANDGKQMVFTTTVRLRIEGIPLPDVEVTNG